MTAPFYAAELRRVVTDAVAALEWFGDAEASRAPAPGKWSIKEIVGHLIDSASNNHQRFVRATWQEELVFPGYDQDAWVSAQRYATASWPDMVILFRTFNAHLAWVMESVPEEIRMRRTTKHNFDQVGFRPVVPGEAMNLDWFMEDYVEHLKHHVRQIERIADGGPGMGSG